MENIDRLLTKYVDELNSGRNPDINRFIELCPDQDRSELRELIKMITIYKNYSEPVIVRRDKAKELFSRLEIMRKEKLKSQQPQKYAANFRKSDLTNEQKKSAKDRLDEIWNKEFGEE